MDTLKESPVLSIKELADRFQVSEMTIRRDIDYLKENRLFYENQASEPAAREHDEYLYSSEQILILIKGQNRPFCGGDD